jgi:hypothetical protein
MVGPARDAHQSSGSVSRMAAFRYFTRRRERAKKEKVLRTRPKAAKHEPESPQASNDLDHLFFAPSRLRAFA